MKSLLIAGLFTSVAFPLTHATTIYEDTFSRSGALNGSAPTTGSGATWISSANLTTDGTQATAPMSPGGANVSSNAYLPTAITVNSGVYELTLTYAATWWGANSFVAVGFATGTTGTDSAFFNDSIGMTTYNRGNDNWTNPAEVGVFGSGANSLGTIAGVNSAGATPLTIKIKLDTYATTNNLIVMTLNASTDNGGLAERSLISTLTEGQINSINAIKIGAYEGQPAIFDNLLFTVTTSPIPEPSTYAAILGLMAAGYGVVVRRNHRR